MIVRNQQELTETDLTLLEYTEFAQIWADYRFTNDDLIVICQYDFLKYLNVGDELILTNEDSGNLHPMVISVDVDDDDYTSRTLKVTRKIYSASSLDVYVVISDNDYFDEFNPLINAL